MNSVTVLYLTIGLLVVPGLRAHETVTISEARKDDNGFLIHEVLSPYQAKTTQIRALQPDTLEKNKKYPLVYVLPVEAETENKYGDGLKEIKATNPQFLAHCGGSQQQRKPPGVWDLAACCVARLTY